MNQIHYDLWNRCREFVTLACAGRDASHGVEHAEKVTKQAILLYLMGGGPHCTTRSPTEQRRNLLLCEIILIGMLHDVGDHKYADEVHADRIDQQHEREAQRLLALAGLDAPAVFDAETRAQLRSEGAAACKAHLSAAIDAISFSKENKKGMRWFAQALPEDWLEARDVVSDSDKLEAIGAEGLFRCYEYTCARYKKRYAEGDRAAGPAWATQRELEACLVKDVADHYEEKLSLLSTRFIVTTTAKYFAEPLDKAMAELLEEWKAHGPPPVTLYWREAVHFIKTP
ncbi:HD superfamily hydrolase [Strigomonas culicis]|uniref:HD superfamily hydrolase n=1 Tax=Strigomonas culicis TaxID=28005 RepID=S9W0A2_9TRYP|nr:HD superfamily hydrolase [Strigomonas culicis]|eukprot:EPY29370.1 HD superfamily hydrolase [Strigomonas culicis]